MACIWRAIITKQIKNKKQEDYQIKKKENNNNPPRLYYIVLYRYNTWNINSQSLYTIKKQI